MTRPLIFVSIGISALALAAGFAVAEYFLPAGAILLLGAAWAYLTRRGWIRFSGPAFAVFAVLAVASLWAQISPALAQTSILFSLSAWDLTHFLQRLKITTLSGDTRTMERAHLQRLALLLGVSILGTFLTTRIRLDLTFGAAAVLALLGIWGISALVYRLHSHE